MASAIGVRIDDVGSILKSRIGFPFRENLLVFGFCQSVWLPGSILNFRIGPVSSIGGLIAAHPVCRHRFRFLDSFCYIRHHLQAMLDRGASDGVTTFKARKGAFDTLNKGFGALGEVK